MSSLSTIKAGVVALTLFVHWTGHDIFDLGSGLVHILLPIWFVLHLSLLPGTGLLLGLSVLLRLEFTLVVIISRPVVLHELMFPFCDESFVGQGLEIWEIKHTESTSEVLVQSSKKSVDLPFFCGHIIKIIAGQMVELVQIFTY